MQIGRILNGGEHTGNAKKETMLVLLSACGMVMDGAAQREPTIRGWIGKTARTDLNSAAFVPVVNLSMFVLNAVNKVNSL